MSPGKKQRAKKPPPPPTPKASHPWDVRPAPEYGDEKEETTYAAVGRALTMWELFEYELSHLFSVLCGGVGPSTAAARAYGAVQTFRGRKEMIEAAAEYYFLKYDGHRDLQKRLKDLLDVAMGYAPRRNEIAHGIVRVYHSRTPGKLAWVLAPGHHSTSKRQLGLTEGLRLFLTQPKYAYSSVEIDYFTERFDDLGPMAGQIRQELAEIPRAKR